VLRGWRLDGLSLWYDEVVSMRLARQPGPFALIELLHRIDATRAPLHPLWLQGWLGLFGNSDLAGRAFSAVCGILTVPMVFLIGRDTFGRRVGLWGAWLAAVCPVLVRYSQEVRMYAWLVLVTCVAWWLLLLRRRGGWGWLWAYTASLTALAYSHPLGLLMNATLAVVSLAIWARRGRAYRCWWLSQAGWLLAVAPWVVHYVDHPPEMVVGRLPIRFLIGTPIESIGGDFRVLAAALGLIGLGAFHLTWTGKPSRLRGRLAITPEWGALAAWWLVPPIALYTYSWVGHPIFGPARYTVFVAPAYLLLVARGLARLPVPAALLLAVGGGWFSASLIETQVYDPERKADWRAAASYLDGTFPEGATVVVATTADLRNVEIEVARYYLPIRFPVVPERDEQGRGWRRLVDPERGSIVFAAPARQGKRLAGSSFPWEALPEFNPEATVRLLPGLNLYHHRGPGSRPDTP
jgi:4-amino-4-deoxy-L-arabinose transferase-like glycosyltransferase